MKTRSRWREVAELLALDIPEDRHDVFDFLETEGFRFCVNFGVNNALAVAVAHWNATSHTRTIH